MVGKRSALRTRITARAAVRLASAWASVWFAVSIWGSSLFSSESLKIVHQAPRGIVSAGLAGCHAVLPGLVFTPSLNAFGPVSLYAGGAGTLGTTYFGPTLQPAMSSGVAQRAS